MRLPVRITFCLILAVLFACAEKEPSRDEIPNIKNVLARFESAVKEKNAAAVDSLIIAEDGNEGYNSTKALSDIYPASSNDKFLTFGKREFFYTRDKAVVNCFIVADSSDPGRPMEITLVKKAGRWYIKQFDLK
jgi:hypothetical protein